MSRFIEFCLIDGIPEDSKDIDMVFTVRKDGNFSQVDIKGKVNGDEHYITRSDYEVLAGYGDICCVFGGSHNISLGLYGYDANDDEVTRRKVLEYLLNTGLRDKDEISGELSLLLDKDNGDRGWVYNF